mmetsp:Transcript_45217/g.141722  ORF Transcript_45217/g.141722 Transcript_45217/m.141722 type:complete len:364 (-) Transcript_45217:156-1247(-)
MYMLLPERAPTEERLREVLHGPRLSDEPRHLVHHGERLAGGRSPGGLHVLCVAEADDHGQRRRHLRRGLRGDADAEEVAAAELVLDARDDLERAPVKALAVVPGVRLRLVVDGALDGVHVAGPLLDGLRPGGVAPADGLPRRRRRFRLGAPALAPALRRLRLGEQAPADERVVDEGLEQRHERRARVAQHDHDLLAGAAEGALDAAHLHGVDEHARESEGHLLGQLCARHGHLEAVAEVDVHNAARLLLEHDVVRVAVAEPEDVARYGAHGEAARVGRAPVEPNLRVLRFEPEHLAQVLAVRVLQHVLEDLDLLHERQLVVVRRAQQHLLLHVDGDAARLAVVLHELVQRVAVRHPADETRVV